MIIQPIVEGQGDEAAVPLLLRRLRNEAQAWGLEVGRPHRRRRTQLVRKDSLQSAVQVAALRGRAPILCDATSHEEPEVPRDAKGELERRMPRGASYSATVDQSRLTAHLDLPSAYRRCRSFRKLVSAFGELTARAGVAPAVWPPSSWVS
jgi:hypothetical protein